MDSSSSREQLSYVMVRNRFINYHTDRGLYMSWNVFESCFGSYVDMFYDLIVFFSLSSSFFLLSRGNTDPYQSAVAGLAPNSGLLGGTPEEAALIDQWVHLAESEVYAFTNFIRGICLGRFAYSKPVRHSSYSSKRNYLT